MKPTTSFPPVDSALEVISRVDWHRASHRVIIAVATVAAVTVGVTLWLLQTARQFWAEHGASVTATARTAATRTVAVALSAWQVAAPVVARTVNRAADWAFYWVADGCPIVSPLPALSMVL